VNYANLIDFHATILMLFAGRHKVVRRVKGALSFAQQAAMFA
jgi:hypothetical protein